VKFAAAAAHAGAGLLGLGSRALCPLCSSRQRLCHERCLYEILKKLEYELTADVGLGEEESPKLGRYLSPDVVRTDGDITDSTLPCPTQNRCIYSGLSEQTTV
jgi:hypothetical protein